MLIIIIFLPKHILSSQINVPSNIHVHDHLNAIKTTVAQFSKGVMDRNDDQMSKNQALQKSLNMPFWETRRFDLSNIMPLQAKKMSKHWIG